MTPSEMTLRFAQRCFMSSYIVLGPLNAKLHDVRIVRLRKALTPGWFANTTSPR